MIIAEIPDSKEAITLGTFSWLFPDASVSSDSYLKFVSCVYFIFSMVVNLLLSLYLEEYMH